MNKVVHSIESAIFAIRWLLVPLYVGLVAALILYITHFLHEVVDMFFNFFHNYAEQNVLLLFILELADMTLISQLVVMTIQGGYAIFIRPFDNGRFGELPQWLKHGLSTSQQKVKMGMSIIGVMIVHFLSDFLKSNQITDHDISIRLKLLGGVIVATLAFCLFDILMHLPFLTNSTHNNKEEHH